MIQRRKLCSTICNLFTNRKCSSSFPKIDSQGLPRFSEITPSLVENKIPALTKKFSSNFEKLEEQLESRDINSFVDVVESLEIVEAPLQFAWNSVTHLERVKNSSAFREVFQKVQPVVVEARTKAAQSSVLYEAFRCIENTPLEEVQKRIIDSFVRNFKLNGVALVGNAQESFNSGKLEEANLAMKFSNNILDSVSDWSLIITDTTKVAGLPSTLLQMMSDDYIVSLKNTNKKENSSSLKNTNKKENSSSLKNTNKKENSSSLLGPWRVTLSQPCYVPFMKYCTDRELRQKVHFAYATRASSSSYDNSKILERILSIRHERAKLLGFSNYAELSITSKMADSVTSIHDMMDQLHVQAFQAAKLEIEALSEFARQCQQCEQNVTLEPCDISYWSERMKSEKFQISDEDLRPYFQFDKVLNGMFELTEKIFGITIRNVPTSVRTTTDTINVWNEHVLYFEVYDEKSGKIAAFYLDPFSRPVEKIGGAWMDVVRDKSSIDIQNGIDQLPVAHLVLNLTPPTKTSTVQNSHQTRPTALMTFSDIQTLFHEFGHGLQHMLTCVPYAAAAGINGVEWDAVEIPSQFMEQWLYHQPTLTSLSCHIEDGRTLPGDMFEKIVASKKHMSGYTLLRQLQFGALDMKLHQGSNKNYDECSHFVKKTVEHLTSRFSIIDPISEDKFLNSFSHIFAGGYSAGYYSYIWAEVLSCDAFTAFCSPNPNESGENNDTDGVVLVHDDELIKTGRRFRNTFLSKGGGRHPMNVFQDFMGRSPNINSLLKDRGLL